MPQSSPERAAGGRKLADRVAERVVGDVIAAGWPAGQMLGSEAELLERHGVSRAVFREAVRLLEHKQVARMRRGPGGGLQITVPDPSTVLDAVSVYASYADISLAEVFDVRRIIERMATELAATRLTEEGLAVLRGEVGADAQPARHGDPHHLHLVIGALTGNPAVELFTAVLVRLTAMYVGSVDFSPVDGERAMSGSDRAHESLVDALVAGDAGLAGHRMGRHLDVLESFLVAEQASQSVLPEMLGRSTGAGEKMAETIARDLFREASERRWPLGQVLGSEAELMERYDVSRAVIREAVRLLEHHGVAEMRRGPGGGLAVAPPRAEAIAEAVSIYLEHRAISPADLFTVRAVLELAAVERCAERMDAAGAAQVRAALEAERAGDGGPAPGAEHDLHLRISELTGNRLLALFVRTLTRLTARRVRTGEGDDPEVLTTHMHQVHERIAEALLSGDGALARHRMRSHLDALVAWVGDPPRSRPD